MRGYFVLALLATFALGLVACGDGGTQTTATAPSAGVPFTITDLRIGTGTQSVAGTPATVNYTGWLYDASASDNKGQVFDTFQGFQFTPGLGAVIAGWDQGVPGMRAGGLRRLVIPPELAYGSQGAGGGAIPPNATLIFEIELVSVP